MVPRMLDHVSLRVQDFPRVLEFYKSALAPIGYDVVMEFPGAAGMGVAGKPDFWIMKSDQPLNPTHVAFSAERARIDAFHAAAVSAGGADNGAPGVRADYHPHYYAAYVLDPEGNNVEVVCHEDPDAHKAPPRPSVKRSARKPAQKAKAAARPAKKLKPSKPPKKAPKKAPRPKPKRR